jgi:predicted transcriptional regulator of viral defense system
MPSTLGPRQNQERKLGQLTASQHCLVTGEQAMKLGLSRAAIRHRLRTERWTQVFPNVYRMANGPETESQHWAAAVLWAGPDAAVSHRSALKLWGYSVDSDFVEVVTTQRRGPVEGTRVHQVRKLPKSM